MSRRLSALVAAVLLVLAGGSEAFSAESDQEADSGPLPAVQTPITASSFSGMGYLFPLRLTLVYGGGLEGSLGGVDSGGQEVLVLRPQRSVRVRFSLIEGVEPLAQLLAADAKGLRPPAPPIEMQVLTLKWKPTWRSHLGAVMSFVVPGTGQFIQRDERAIGVLFLVSDLFFLTASVLAFVGPSQLQPAHRRLVGGTFAGLALTTSIISSVHAFRAGREPGAMPRD